jgi:tetratricopeptide (TPR) repeat protein
MIVDNADDPGVLMGGAGGDLRAARLYDYLPYSNKGKILFTTRSRKVAGDLTQSSVLDLNDMSKTEAWQLLARRVSNPALLDNREATEQLLETLTYLPLAIVQAAAFVNNNNISVSRYMSLFRKTGTELFSEHFEDPSRYREMEGTIAKTWLISVDQIRIQDPLAAEYLSFIACIDRINIPRSLLPPGGSPMQQAKAIGTLTGYAFLTERQQVLQEPESERFFDMHRLVHMVSVWWLDGHAAQTAWTVKAAARLKELIPYGGHEGREAWTMYLPHAIHVARLNGTLDGTARASLLDRIGRCQASLGQYSAAETTHRQALVLREKGLGEEHNQTLISMNEVGFALGFQGKYREAEFMNRQTLALKEKVLGLEHPDTLTSMNNLALVLSRQGKYEEAESMNRQTLALKEKVLGLEHPDTLASMNNLASVLDRQGKYEEAESMNRQTLALKEKVLGLEHPDTLASMNNLALVLDRQGKYEEAESMNRQTLAQSEKVLGLEHPSTLTSMNNLASVLDRQGKYEEAESMNRQTLALKEKVLGLEHLDTLTSVYCLAHLLANRHRYYESADMYERACAGFIIVLGNDHPTTRACWAHHSKMLASQEQDRLAVPLGIV